MSAQILYSDHLVEMTHRDILFRLYYCPFGAKKVPFADVESIEVVDCTLRTGKWRLWGTGDFRTWFPCDWRRFTRDKIFFLRRRGGTMRIGFSVEDSAAVISVLEKRVVLKT
ncbi:MAG: hypothetical protein AB1646_19925 [Thermodesulfobacteriota bacterium]